MCASDFFWIFFGFANNQVVLHRHVTGRKVFFCVWRSLFCLVGKSNQPRGPCMSVPPPKPTDSGLYARIKARVWEEHPKPSAYRSGMLVREYKDAFRRKHGEHARPYTGGPKPHGNLFRWFREQWRNQDGKVGYHGPSDVYRPSRRVDAHTPLTWRELSPTEVRRARREKSRTGRVTRFRPRSKSQTR